MSILAQQRIREAKEKKLTRLDIGNCGLTEIPDEVFELTWLEELILSDTWREYSFQELDSNHFISKNKGKANNIKSINLEIGILQNLKKLIITRQEINDITSLTPLIKLEFLNIANTYVSNLSSLKNLMRLKGLDISDTKINNLSPISNLKQLLSLFIDRTQVSDLNPLKKLTNLRQLGVSSTQIDDLSPLKDLTELVEFYISRTKIKDLDSLKNLVQIQYLTLDFTLISDLSPLKYLKYLKYLDIHATKISDLTPLKNLLFLQNINASSTEVKNLRPLEKIIAEGALVNIDRYGEGILVEYCPITNPPIKIAKQGNKAILRYWQEQDRVGKQKVNEARLLLVGQGESGKTTLKEKLKDRHAAMPEPDATTRGIDITPIIHKNTEGSDFTVQVWDFGGQNIQKYAHQFFMSDSVVYAVLSNTREQNPNFQYWLNIIELLGKDSPFFIVQNEKDGHKEPLKDITQITERFPQTFRGVEQLNLKNAATDPLFESLKLKLFHAATQLPHTQKEYLTSFVNVRNQLETLSKTEQSIPFKHFKDLCKAEGIEDVELMNDYARTFTLLGIALHFADDAFLKPYVFLRPKWIIDALFAVLYAEKVENQDGKFSEADAETIWHEDEYDGLHGILLKLMVKFHLCYELPNTKEYIVPQRLKTRTEPFTSPADATHILYRYRFLPSGILTQLTCRLHQRIEGDKVWNDAVQFGATSGDGHVFVRENSAANSLDIFGFGQQKADLLNEVVNTIDEIHQNSKFGNLKVDKLVPCPCSTCADRKSKQEDPYFFKYSLLINDLRDGETQSDKCEFSRKRFSIRDILKHASIRLFKIEAIKDLLSNDKIEEALKILRGQFQEENEVIVQLSRLSSINREYQMGRETRAVYAAEKTKIAGAVLWLLKEWEGTTD